ncbi:MAG: hypothetical protein ACWGIK_10520 [Achromobacter pulmonis]|uniref:hypothetical protein n=1 Tax=Achromobacter pulmonis TaxID=1389932 RepID=UPI001F17E1D3|nr:hypothetical protein [Achromobacter pulmonis]
MPAFVQRIWGYAVAALVAVPAVALIYLRGRSAGRADERQERKDQINEQAAKARQEVRNVENEVASMDDDAVSDRLKSDWARAAPARVGVEYCGHARPIDFDSAAQVDQIPAQVRRQGLEVNEAWLRLCRGRSVSRPNWFATEHVTVLR